jgi:hypothetical protein
MRWKLSSLALGCLALAACNGALLGPAPAQLSAADVLVGQLTVAPSLIAPGGSLTATYTIYNAGPEDAHLTTACVALARGVVYHGDVEAHFIGSGSGCRTALGQYLVPAGETLRWSWDVTASIMIEAYPDGRPPLTRPVEPGVYVFRVEPDVMIVNGEQASLPHLSHAIVVN